MMNQALLVECFYWALYQALLRAKYHIINQALPFEHFY